MKKTKILFIEDDQIFANVYRNKMVLEGFNVEIAHDGEEGLELLHSFSPDAVLLDLMLPKLPGLEVIKKIRSNPSFEQLPIVVFSNTYLTSLIQEAWRAGATKCLAKANCTPSQVIGTLLSLINGKGTAKSTPAAIPVPADEPALELPPADNTEEEFQGELRKSFMESWPATLVELRTELQSMIRATNEDARLQHIHQLSRRVHMITGSANIVGLLQIAQLTDAFEALLRELQDKPRNITISTKRTVALAVDFLGILFEQEPTRNKNFRPANVLVVEDEAIARRAVTFALDKAKLKYVAVEDPLEALRLLPDNKFDLIFLDVDMPTMNGFELCAKLRTLPDYKTTPVVFITGLNDLESRANSTMSGGTDFIAKPFMFIELAVKALVYVVRAQLQTVRK